METLSYREQLEGFPVFQIGVLSVVRLSESIAETSLFPYIFHYVKHLGIAKDPSEVSIYISYLTSVSSFFQIVCNVYWGRQAEKIGRKPVLMIGMFGLAVSLLLYGFSNSFTLAMVSKIIGSCLNANMATIRTAIGEVASDKKHQAIAFSTIPLFFNVGYILGPVIASHFITNTSNSDTSAMSLFQKYPFALPNIIIFLVLIFSIAIVFLFFEETHGKLKYKRDVGLNMGDYILKKIGFQIPDRNWMINAEDSARETLISNTTEDLEMLDTRSPAVSFEELENRSFWDAFTPNVIHTILSQCGMLFHMMTYSHYLSSFLAAKLNIELLGFPFRIKGGFGLTVKQISSIMSVGGVTGVIIVLFVSPRFNGKIGALRSYRVSLITFPIIYFMLPITIFAAPEFSGLPGWIFKVLPFLVNMLKEFAGVLAFSYIFILIHRSSRPEHLSVVNGAAMSLAGIGNFLSPLIEGRLMAYFDSVGMMTLFWWLLCALSIVGVLHSYLIKSV